MLARQRRGQRHELAGIVLVRDLDLELGLPRRDVVGLLDVVDPWELEKDLVVPDRLNHGLGHAEAVDAPVDDVPRPRVVVGDALARGNLGGPHLQHKLRPAL